MGMYQLLQQKKGINGLYDMGGNVWEWVDIKDNSYKGTKGGSWWYGKNQMIRGYTATKPKNMSAYILVLDV